jgi:uncharacterized protein (TIGR02301 family)
VKPTVFNRLEPRSKIWFPAFAGMSGFLLALMVACLPTEAAAQPPRAEMVFDLAYATGQSHALRQLCQGADDQYWRERMERIIALEAKDETSRAPLAERFNDGFRAARQQYPRCTEASRTAERAVAANGRALANLLARAATP